MVEIVVDNELLHSLLLTVVCCEFCEYLTYCLISIGTACELFQRCDHSADSFSFSVSKLTAMKNELLGEMAPGTILASTTISGAPS